MLLVMAVSKYSIKYLVFQKIQPKLSFVTCEEAFQMSCCSPKIKSVLVKDQCHANIAKRKRKRRENKHLIISKSSQCMLDESVSKSEKNC